jgi:serine/threonine protein kinase
MAFSNKNLCHRDIKPSNMMVEAGSRTIVTIDSGSTVQYGEQLLAITNVCAGLPTERLLHYDHMSGNCNQTPSGDELKKGNQIIILA